MPDRELMTAAKEILLQANEQRKKPAAAVEVANIKTINKGSLRAFCSVVIGGLKINSCRLIQEEGKSAWVSLPQQEWTDRDGKKRYAPIVEVPDPVKAAIQDAVVRAWEGQAQ